MFLGVELGIRGKCVLDSVVRGSYSFSFECFCTAFTAFHEWLWERVLPTILAWGPGTGDTNWDSPEIANA